MKKIFLLVAFAGIVGASSTTSLMALNKKTTITFKQDDKKKKEGAHDCSKHAKGECHKGSDSTKHDCSKHTKGKKDCCKKGAAPEVHPK